MGYKSASESLHLRVRAGSHATKGSARGYLNISLPKEEKEMVSLDETINLLQGSIDAAYKTMGTLQNSSEAYKNASSRVQSLESQAREIIKTLDESRSKHRSLLFYRISKTLLPKEAFAFIERETDGAIDQRGPKIKSLHEKEEKNSCGNPACDKAKDGLQRALRVANEEILRIKTCRPKGLHILDKNMTRMDFDGAAATISKRGKKKRPMLTFKPFPGSKKIWRP